MFLPIFMAVYLLGALITGLFGTSRRIGFIGFFILALVLSPPVTLMLLVLTRPKPVAKPL
ncbi:hypothetical protein [Janthinobacterium agaricidamnosum]|uniref:Putative membrane protein n=2 Tax=Janthinobacterium agaricidamnosum TaxID=55508 RepID=W0UYV1_9BURK|nr:hypothetical protein [Janthinobacterium agaricidamnosum]CCM43856.1 putative membrane protein [Janthinobacterium agaricidamnosum]CDG80821.1 putative membrane protein [Janthinobacterium agaricidamnosum NBRC 102515 = DSM 9628]